MEKVQWNSIYKKQNGLKYSKNDKSSTLPSKQSLLVLNLYYHKYLTGENTALAQLVILTCPAAGM